jgi:hypothetical protein
MANEAFIRFREFHVSDDRRSVSQEESVAFFLAFAGIHVVDSKFELAFGSDVDDGYQVSDVSELIDNNTVWVVADDHSMSGVGTEISDTWYSMRFTTEIEDSFVISFDTTSTVGGFLFGLNDNNTGYILSWDGSEVMLGTISGDGEVFEEHIRVPCSDTGPASIIIGIHFLSYSKIDQIDDLGITLYMDGKQVFTHTMIKLETSPKIGFASYQTSTMTVDNVRLSHAYRPVDWSSVDPGEAVATGLGRVLANTKLRLLARYDGSVLIRKEKTGSSDWTMDDRETQYVRERGVYSPSHVRLVGALHEYDSIRDSNVGNVFAEANDPNALTYDEVQDKSGWYHARIEEESQRKQIAMPPQVTLEPGDIITIDGVDWRVESINYDARWDGAPLLASSVNLIRSIDE